MKSYTTLRNLYGTLTNNISSTNLTLGDQLINDAQRKIISASNGDYAETSATDVTVANQKNYKTPYNYEKMNSMTITIGTYKYPIKESPDRRHWDMLQRVTFTSDFPVWFYIDSGEVLIYPTPSTSSNTISYYYKQRVRDLSNADYTTGTVTLTNGSTTVTGAGTTFTAGMIGRYIKSNTDGFWYKIVGYTSATVITLDKKWQGTTAAGLAFTIGEFPIIPETYHDSLVHYSAYQYWLVQEDGVRRAEQYRNLWDEALLKIKRDRGQKTSVVSVEREDGLMQNPNLFIETV